MDNNLILSLFISVGEGFYIKALPFFPVWVSKILQWVLAGKCKKCLRCLFQSTHKRTSKTVVVVAFEVACCASSRLQMTTGGKYEVQLSATWDCEHSGKTIHVFNSMFRLINFETWICSNHYAQLSIIERSVEEVMQEWLRPSEVAEDCRESLEGEKQGKQETAQ